MEWKIKLLGTRGSIPVTGNEFSRFGGDTLCIAAECEDMILVFDAGTGLTHLNLNGKKTHIFISHYHHDHIIGLCKWKELLNPLNEITFHLPTLNPGEDGIEIMRNYYKAPFWPINLEQLPAKIQFVAMEESCQLGLVRVDSIPGYHAGGARYYRLTDDDTTMTYLVDCELPENTKNLAQFAAGTNLLFIDGQLDEKDLPAKKGWGHSTMLQAAAFGENCKAERTVLVHVDVDATDEELLSRTDRLHKAYPHCCFGVQGEIFRL